MPPKLHAGASSKTGVTPVNYRYNTRSNTTTQEISSEETSIAGNNSAEQNTQLPVELPVIHQQQSGESVAEPAETVNNQDQDIGLVNSIENQNSFTMSHIILPHFHDETSQVPALWWTMFENYIKLHKHQEEAALAAFSFHVQGQALTWYHLLPADDKNSLVNLKAAFLERFKHHSTNNELYRVQQHPHETGIQYLTRVQNLASGAVNMNEQTVVGLTINGLNQDIKGFVVGKDPKTINELREAIYLATSVAQCNASSANTCTNNQSSSNVQSVLNNSTCNTTSINDLCSSLVEGIRSVLKEEVMAISASNDVRGRQQNFRSSPRQQQQMKCSYCGRSHVIDRRKCPAYNSVCHYCTKLGHFKEVCQKSLRDLENNSTNTNRSQVFRQNRRQTFNH